VALWRGVAISSSESEMAAYHGSGNERIFGNSVCNETVSAGMVWRNRKRGAGISMLQQHGVQKSASGVMAAKALKIRQSENGIKAWRIIISSQRSEIWRNNEANRSQHRLRNERNKWRRNGALARKLSKCGYDVVA